MTEKILFIGDSHIIPVRTAFPALTPAYQVAGGPLPLGRGWIKNFHTDDGTAQFHLVVPDAQNRLLHYVSELEKTKPGLLELDAIIVCSFTSLEGVIHHWDWLKHYPDDDGRRHFMSDSLFMEILENHYKHCFRFFEILTNAGRTCLNIVSPGPRMSDNGRGRLFFKVRDRLKERYEAMGVHVVDSSHMTCDKHGALKQELWSNIPDDKLHGNAEWGKIVAKEVWNTLQEINHSEKPNG